MNKADFAALWVDMHRYFTVDRGLDNLLWVYSVAVQTSSEQKSALYYYPGSNYVDLVGLDWYDDELKNLDGWKSYSQLAGLKKPLGLTEIGPRAERSGSFDTRALLAAVTDHPNIAFFVSWHSWPGAKVALADNVGTQSLLDDPRVISLDAN